MSNISQIPFNKEIKIKVGIIGGAGYTGGELLRLLINHPFVEINFVHSKSQAGLPISAVHQDLSGDTDLRFIGELPSFGSDSEPCHGEQPEVGSDSEQLTVSPNHDNWVVFLCLGHGDARKFLDEHNFPAHVRLIDLSNDFRLAGKHTFGERSFVYGLPELNRAAIQEAKDIANPGCFATAIQLGLLPLAQAGILAQVHTTGITGSTGAGQSLSTTSHFSWRVGNIQSYKTLTHQHLGEIAQSLQQLQPTFGGRSALHFVPWRGDFSRGIFASSMVETDLSFEEISEHYKNFYKDQSFTHVITEPLHLKMVTNTNKCLIQLEKVDNQLVIHSVIDNLLKGASGQAVQNMNLMFGLPEDTGLRLKGNAF